MTESESSVQYRYEDHIAWITLNRPERLNALDGETYELLEDQLRQSREDDARVVVFQGNGRAFCSGADYKSHQQRDRTYAEKREYVWTIQNVLQAVQEHPVPTVTRVHGYAIGAGAELALSTDLIVMADDAEIRLPELELGTYVGGGVTYTLPQRVGVAKAKELVFTSASVGADEAEEIGLVDRTAPADELDDAVAELAESIAKQAPIPTQFAKAQLNDVYLDKELLLTREADALLTCMNSTDWERGREAFGTDERPTFEGN